MTFATATIYIKDMLELYRPDRDLRSSSKGLQLTVPRSYRCAGDRAFPLPDLPGGTSCHPLFKEARHSRLSRRPLKQCYLTITTDSKLF